LGRAVAGVTVWLRLYPSKAPQIASKVLELNKSTAKKVLRDVVK
jgi:hypothetical protein